jgi:heat shock protein HtpX
VKRIGLLIATNFAVMLVLGVALTVLQGVLGISFSGVLGLLIFSALFGFIGAFISLAISKWSAKKLTGAVVIEQPRTELEVWLVDTVARLAQQADIGMPEIAIFDNPTPNAFATGARRDNSMVAVSTGLLRAMDRRQAEAVIGHEIAHVANGDMVTMTLLQGVLNTFVIFLSRLIGGFIDREVFKSRDRGIGYFMSVIVLQILFGILASMIAASFSRRREFRADAGGAELTSRDAMASALERLAGPSTAEMPEALAAFGIRENKATGWRKLVATHPPIEDRIAALRQMPSPVS